jgi:hypothetical protein
MSDEHRSTSVDVAFALFGAFGFFAGVAFYISAFTDSVAARDASVAHALIGMVGMVSGAVLFGTATFAP